MKKQRTYDSTDLLSLKLQKIRDMLLKKSVRYLPRARTTRVDFIFRLNMKQ